jgi:hypothetical protein
MLNGTKRIKLLEFKLVNYQIITPEDNESFTRGNISAKAALVKPFHV